MEESLQKFGSSSWTQDKLNRVRKYLVAYCKIMPKYNYHYAYIDGFAGTGYHEVSREGDDELEMLFPEVAEPEVKEFLDGSARIVLEVDPPFKHYIFIEKSPKKTAELEKLRDEFPDKRDLISIETADANVFLNGLCRQPRWKDHRAVLFIDPFGMQLTWETIKAIALTKGIDTWILFPVGAVNRLLKKDGDIPPSWRQRLDTMFGEPGWFDVFFPEEKSALFGDDLVVRSKTADMASIGEYFNRRLAKVFAGVAPNPYTLRNSKGCAAVPPVLRGSQPEGREDRDQHRTGHSAQGARKATSPVLDGLIRAGERFLLHPHLLRNLPLPRANRAPAGRDRRGG